MGAPGMADGMMDEFMQQPQHMPQPAMSPMAMEQMRREFEALHTGPQQGNRTPNWAGEFDPGIEENARMEAAFRTQNPAGLHPADFERFVQMRVGHSPSPVAGVASTRNEWQRPMGVGMGYNGMGFGAMGMQPAMYNQPMYGTPVQPVEAQDKGKGKERMIELDDKDWEAQFAQLETDTMQGVDVDEEANQAMNARLDEMDRSVPDLPQDGRDVFNDFEKVWRKIKAELPTSRALLDDELVDDDRWREHIGDGYPEWDNFDSGLNGFMRDPQLGDYLFEDSNLFDKVNDPFAEGVRIMDEGGNLSLAALAFEAAVHKNPEHVEAWTRLGAAQAQNEKESPAIRALEQAIKLDPTNLDALMGLAVSYTNEGYDSTAYRTLERWLSIKYPSVTANTTSANAGQPTADPSKMFAPDPFAYDLGFTDRQQLHERVTDLFIRAAQLSPSPETMDPDVQVGLGVLFYGAEEFDKAVDCFSAALASTESGTTNSRQANQRPLLWNRLGATLANSGRSEEAIQAYERALDLNPNFVRARYNLGVSCINIGCYAEAAQHLLGALSMHKVVEKESREAAKEFLGGGGPGAGIDVSDTELENILRQNQSTNLYDTLRRVFGQMGRKDLADKVVSGVDVEIFRGEFEF